MDSRFSVVCANNVVKVELIGRLDATNSEALQNEIKQHAGKGATKLVFIAKDLEYISSAGLRVIIFAKQKIGVDAHIFMIAAGPAILNVIKMSGLDNFMTLQDSWTE